MRYEILTRYREQFQNGDFKKMLFDTYQLNFDKCVYYKVLKDGTIQEVDNTSSIEDIDWIKQRDMYSEYLTCAKSIGDKKYKFMSNNYLSVFIKIVNIPLIGVDILVEKYFGAFLEVNEKVEKILSSKKEIKSCDKLYTKMTLIDEDIFNCSKQLLTASYEKMREIYSEENLKQKKESMSNNEYGMFVEKKVKLFYDEDISIYNQEISNYYTRKIFVDNDYCFEKEGILYGVPAFNISLNAKKPYLTNLTMDCKSFYIPLQEAIWFNDINLYLKSLKVVNKKDPLKTYMATEIYLPNIVNEEKDTISIAPTKNKDSLSNVKIEIDNGTEYVIEDSNITDSTKDMIKVLNIMEYKDEKDVEKNIFEIYNDFEKIIYNKEDKKSSEYIKKDCNFKIVKNMLSQNPHTFVNYYEKFIKKLLNLIYKNDDYLDNKICHLLNIKYSLKKYFEGGLELNIRELQDNIYSKITNKGVQTGNELESDEEFLFLYGQTYRYIISYSKALKKSQDLLNAPKKMTNETTLKLHLKEKLQKYSYAINLNNEKLSSALVLLMNYELKEDLNFRNNDFLYIGMHFDNLYFRKKDKEDIVDSMEDIDNVEQ